MDPAGHRLALEDRPPRGESLPPLFQQQLKRVGFGLTLIAVAGKGPPSHLVVFPPGAFPECKVANFQVPDPVFHAHTDPGVENGAVADRDPRISPPGWTPQAKADLIVPEQALLDAGLHVLLEIHCCHQTNLSGLIPAMKQAPTHSQFTARTVGRGLGIKAIFTGTLALLKACSIGGEGTGPERTVLDEHLATGSPVRVELHTIS